MIGPSKVPSPPTITQMMIWPLTGRLNMVGLTNTAIGEQHAGDSGHARRRS